MIEKMTMDRRTLLAAALAGPMTGSARLYAAPAGSPRLFVLFLRGAYDSSSVLVPNTSFYAESRPTLVIPRTGTGAAVALDANWGLNPVLAPSLLPFWKRGELAFIPFAGTPDMSRSHFATQDIVEYGQPLGKRPAVATGFLNRLASEMPALVPMAFTKQLTPIFRGPVAVANVVPADTRRGAAGNPRQSALLAGMYAKDKGLGAQVAEGFASKEMVSAALANEMVTSGKGAVSAGGFELAARRIGKVMRGRPNLCFADVGGWDTHIGQRGALDFHLGSLGRGLAGFAEEIGPAEWQRTTVLVISEFGRTFRENGNRGTDHGHGTSFWAMGGNVRGGKILGEQVKVSRATLNEDRDYPVLNEYRSVIGGVVQRMYGLDAARMGRVFPGAKPRDLAIV